MTVGGLLLAGGMSRRMGRDKATLVFGDQPLWSKQVSLLQSLGAQPILVSARTVPAWLPPCTQLLLDTPPSKGPLSGLAAALAHIETSHLLALAVDLPQLTVEHLRKLIAMAEPGFGVVPRSEEYFEPLCAIYPKGAADYAQAALTSGDVSLQSLVGTLRDRGLVKEYALSPGERLLYRNYNTPDDLA
jgi:molybdenum cofactor guanylyltransferase